MNTIRKMDNEHLEEMFQLAAYAFNAEITEKRKERFSKLVIHSDNYGSFSNTLLTSQLIATPFIVTFHGIHYQMAGIGCVSSYPEYRGQGGISKLMAQLLSDLYEKKAELAYLAPFSYPFYRKYGFEQIFENLEYTIQAADWPNSKPVSGRMYRASFEEFKRSYKEIYLKMPENQRGALVREEWWLDYSFGMNQENQYALYEDAFGKVKGYLIYQSKAERFTIKEWGYLTKAAFQSITRFIGSHNGASKEFYFETGYSGENLSYLMPAPLVEMTVTPAMMGRIVHLESFLEAYPFKKGNKERYYFEIDDPYIIENTGFWELVIDEQGKGKMEKLGELPKSVREDQLIKGSIQSFTQLFMGYKTGSQLHFYEKIIGSTEEIQALDACLVTDTPVLADYF